MLKITPFSGLLLLALGLSAHAQEAAPAALPRTAAPESALTYLVSPANGATVTLAVHDSLRFARYGRRARRASRHRTRVIIIC